MVVRMGDVGHGGTEEEDAVLVDLHGADAVYWVCWPSLLAPDVHYVIGWPMRLRDSQDRPDN